MAPRAPVLLAAIAIALGLAAACGTNATGVTACENIETARCMHAGACGISLQPPYYNAGSDIDACIRFYKVACLHGLSGSDPGPTAVQACVAAINTGNCDIVRAPETSTACAFLIPPAPPPAAEAGDAPTDGPTDASDAASE